MQIGDKYLAEWHFNYDMVDCILGVITISNIYDNGGYSFTYTNKWSTSTYRSNRCRNIKIIKKVDKEMSRYIVLWNGNTGEPNGKYSGHKVLNDKELIEFLHDKYEEDGEDLSEEEFTKVIKKIIKNRSYEYENLDTGIKLIIEIEKV